MVARRDVCLAGQKDVKLVVTMDVPLVVLKAALKVAMTVVGTVGMMVAQMAAHSVVLKVACLADLWVPRLAATTAASTAES